MGRRNLMAGLATGAAAIAMMAMGGSTAGAATAGVSGTFAGAGITSTYNGSVGGPDYDEWTLTGVSLGTSPVLGTLSISYAYGEPGADLIEFTFTSSAGTLAANGYGAPSTSILGTNTLTGLVTSGTGAYAGLVNHADIISVDVSSKVLYTVEQELGTAGSLIGGLSEVVSPSVIVGTISIS